MDQYVAFIILNYTYFYNILLNITIFLFFFICFKIQYAEKGKLNLRIQVIFYFFENIISTTTKNIDLHFLLSFTVCKLSLLNKKKQLRN